MTARIAVVLAMVGCAGPSGAPPHHGGDQGQGDSGADDGGPVGWQALWRVDTSGYDEIPNPEIDSVDDLKLWSSRVGRPSKTQGHYELFLAPGSGAQTLDVVLPSLDPGSYGFDWNGGATLVLVLTSSGRYFQSDHRSEGEIDLDRNDGVELDGSFSGRLCGPYRNDSCVTVYDGQFRAPLSDHAVLDGDEDEVADGVDPAPGQDGGTLRRPPRPDYGFGCDAGGGGAGVAGLGAIAGALARRRRR